MPRPRTLVVALVTVSSLLGLSACSSNGDSLPPPSEKSYEFKPNVKLLDQSQQIVSQDAESLLLSGTATTFNVGDVVVSTVGDGALRRVVTVTEVQGNTRLQTEQAGLTDAFDKLKFRYNEVLGPDILGTLQSNVPGIELSWQNSPATVSAQTLTGPSLQIGFKQFAVSAGIEIDGSANFQLEPNFALDLVSQPGDTLPTLTLEASSTLAYSHQLTLSSKFGGTVTGERKAEFKLKPIVVPDPPIVIVPYLTLKSSLSGTAAGKFGTAYTASFSGQARIVRGPDGEFKYEQSLTPAQTAQFDVAEASLGVQATPLQIGLEFRLYNIGGPVFELSAQGSLTGSFEVDGVSNKEGIRAVAKGALVATPSVKGDLSLLKLLFKDASGEFTFVSRDFVLDERELFNAFFPFQGEASIVVTDNGSSPDDIFEVAVNGTVVGRTTKGGSGQFRITSLPSGPNQLQITTVEDDNPPGTWGINLANGVTFSDGTTSKSGGLTLGQSQTFTIIVP